jgi:periplasmic protein TonB
MGRKRYDMFRESLLEECSDRSSRRRWATLSSFLLQIVAAGVVVVLPFLYPDALPLVHASSSLLMPPPSGGPPRPPDPSHTREMRSAMPPVLESTHTIHIPGKIPKTIDMSADPIPAQPFSGRYVEGSIASNDREQSTLWSELLPPPNIHPTLKKQSVPAARVSAGVSQGLLISRVEPRYPPIAVTAHIQGDVVLTALIGRDGRIENLHVIEGHPTLAQAALDAVKQWRYRPYMLGSEAVEVETQVTVRFRLNGGQ